jgi:hypothetical protein
MDPHAWCRCLAVLAVCAVASVALAQKKVEIETKSGKLTSVEKKGKAAAVKVETDDGETLDVQVTPRMQFAIQAPGEKEILRVGTWVSVSGVAQVNNLFFSENYLVHIGAVPQAKMQKNMNNSWDVAGPIGAVADDSITLRSGAKIMFDEGKCNVTVQTNDIALLEEGAPAQIEGTKRGEKFLTQRMMVTLDKTLTAEDVYGPAKGKAKKTTARTTKTTDDKAAGDKADAPKATDPFSKKPQQTGDAAPKPTDPFAKKPQQTGDAAPKPTDPFKDKPKEK